MKIRLILPASVAAAVATVVSVSPVLGQEAKSSRKGLLEEVMVTAQKREQSIQDIPLSVSSFSGEQMEQLGVSDFTEITQQIPGLQLNTWSPNLTIFNLRGVSQNNFTDNLEAPVATYIDDVYIGSMNGLSGQMFDIKRVEVLRGPQGTLFGRNATGGLIHYISRDASEEETNGYLRAEAGNFNRYNLEGAVGFSLSDSVRTRLSGRIAKQDGYIKSVATDPNPTPYVESGEDIGATDAFSLRAAFQVDFSETLQGNFLLKYSQDDNVRTGGYAFERCELDFRGLCPIDPEGRTITQPGVIDPFNGTTADEHEHFSDVAGFLDRDQYSATARFDWALDNGMELTSITNYMGLDKTYVEDGDALVVPILTLRTEVDYSQFSQELRLSGETDSMRWQVGAYYLNMDFEGDIRTIGAPAFNNIVASGRILNAGGVDTSFSPVRIAFPGNAYQNALTLQETTIDSSNWSIFGQADYDLSDKLTLTAGLRWSQDIKDIDWTLRFSDNFNPSPLLIESSDGFSAVNPSADEVDYGDWAGRLALNYALADDTIIFASINRGIKGGNWSVSPGTNLTAQTFQHDEEVLYSYEAGFKTGSDSLRVNGTVFYYDYNDYQAFSLAGGAPFVNNTDAKASGGELEVFWSPTANLDIILGAAFMDSEVDEVLGRGIPITDAELPNAPKFSFNYLFRYNMDVAKGNLALQVDGAYYDDQFLEVTNGSGTVQPAYNVSNASVTYTTYQDKYTITGWVKNFTDETFKVYSLDLGALGVTTYYAPPITYGLTARMNF